MSTLPVNANSPGRWLLVVMLALVSIMTTTAVTGQARQPNNPLTLYGERVEYDIFRKGKKIGTHSVEFAGSAQNLSVTIESRIKVTVLKVPVFRFNYRATEEWQNGQLVRVDVSVNENGKLTRNKLVQDSNGARLDANGTVTNTPAVAIASNHWSASVVSTKRIYNTLTGKINQVQLIDLGTDQIQARGATINARHYKYTGDLDTDVWYDEQGRWAKLAFQGNDGSTITYVVR